MITIEVLQSFFMIRLFTYLLVTALVFPFLGCYQCMVGGRLIAKQNYTLNKCGFSSGVQIQEIKVDSFSNNVPAKYSTTKWCRLYDDNRRIDREPKRLYYSKHCDTIHVSPDAKMQCPFKFNNNTWYWARSDNVTASVFIYVNNAGKKISYFPY